MTPVPFTLILALATDDAFGTDGATVVANSFSWDGSTFTASWRIDDLDISTTATAVIFGRYRLQLSDNLFDQFGRALNGEWTNPTSLAATSASTQSGNSTAGGDFEFKITFFPVDFTADHEADNDDLGTLLNCYNQTSGQHLANGDVDGDGDVDGTDLGWLLNWFNTSI
jgi:hypothetical protein